MVLVGCKPKGRYTEQHDVFFGIGRSLKELIPAIKIFWPEAKGLFHIDAWREVTQVNSHAIVIEESAVAPENKKHLFFLNLGGYRPGEFEELHYKMLVVAENSGTAIANAKQTDFYKAAGYKGAESHIDDKYNLDVDDIYNVSQMLLPLFTEKFHIRIMEQQGPEDSLHIGYVKLSKLPGKE
jgi:hypothetical protein